MLDDLLTGAHFAVRLPGYLHRTIDLEGGSALIRRRIEERETSFLELAQRAIYAQPDSPYRALLEHVGCEPGDLVRSSTKEWMVPCSNSSARVCI